MTEIQLPQFLDSEDEETIMARMLASLPEDIDKSEGSFIWDSLMPVAQELARILEWGREILHRGSITETFGPYLDLKAAEQGITRTPATYSTGIVTLYGDEGTVIPAGSRVATPSDNITPSIEFEITETVTIGSAGEVEAPIRAIEPGASGNVEAGNITILSPSIQGVTSVINHSPTKGGYDEESDESLRKRILEESRKNEGDGNVDDYIAWAKEISGVGNVLVEPKWKGPGTIRVVILDQNGKAASPELIQAVQNHLDPGQKGIGEGKAPVGAKVTVDTATVLKIKATITNLIPESGYTIEQAKVNAEAALKDYLNHINPGGTIRIKEAEAAIIHAPGVLDMGDLYLNDSRENITLSTVQLGDLGSVVYK